MDLKFSTQEEAFRDEVRDWLETHLSGEFAHLRGRGGPGDEHETFEDRVAWEQKLGEGGWIGLGWPKAYGGREATLMEQVIFNEEYSRARAPGRVGHIGEQLMAPTLIAFGSEAQKERFLPPIRRGEELWCQGYSEPNAGSDLANVQTKAERDHDQWVITGQKVWTSLAHWSHWCFVICRTDPSARKHKGLSYLLVPMDQDGITIRPITQPSGLSEFNEVFFDGARTEADCIIGQPGDGWKVAMGTLAVERGVSTLGQQLNFQNELLQVIAIARNNGRSKDPHIRQRLARAWMELKIMRLNALRTLSAAADGKELTREGMINKLYWATWHRELGKLAMDILGPEAEIADGSPYELGMLQKLFLFTRSDTIYAGTNQIQRNIIGERALGLPREPRVPQPSKGGSS
ncbi:MAG: acyl-CoA dehydrogenase family protein [Myxococcota bacterium]